MNLIGKIFVHKKVKTLRKDEVMKKLDIRRALGGVVRGADFAAKQLGSQAAKVGRHCYADNETLNLLPFIKKFYPTPLWGEGDFTKAVHENSRNFCHSERQRTLKGILPRTARYSPTMQVKNPAYLLYNTIKLKGIHMNNLTETNHASKSLGIFASKTVSCRHSNADLQKKVAFTLAEVLITLGIIGVVAALTLPTVIKHYKAKVLETAFKKSVTNLYQAYDLTRQQLGTDEIYSYYTIYSSQTNSYPNIQEFQTAFENNLKVIKNSTNWWDFYPIYNYNKTKLTTENIGTDYPNATKILADGSSYNMHVNFDGNQIAVHIYIDTNGPYKGPNQYGHDIFKFQIRHDNKLSPVKMNKLYTEEELEKANYKELVGYPCSVKSKQATNGAGCSYYAMNNINPDDNSKKYWESLP